MAPADPSKPTAPPTDGGLRTELARRLAAGPIPFRDWMEACLYGDGGYYMRPGKTTGAGDDADFATNPTLHPFFGECIGREVADAGSVWEFGGGEGDLARQAGTQADWHHIEISPAHRAAQAGSGKHVDALPLSTKGVVVAHEFLDALPVHLLQRTEAGWEEMCVGLREDDRFAWTTGPAPAAAVAEAPDAPVGHRVAVNLAAKTWLQDVATRLESGRIIIVDYGADDVWRRDREWGTLRTFRQHHDAGSPLEDPGDKDITTSIDFRQLRAWAEAAGFRVASDESQEEFLLRHGVLARLNQEDRTTTEGASRYLRLRQMLLPTGMGHAFRVLVLEK